MARSKLRSDARFKIAGQLKPKKYGTKVDLNHKTGRLCFKSWALKGKKALLLKMKYLRKKKLSSPKNPPLQNRSPIGWPG